MRRFIRLLTPRVGIAVLGATLGLSGTAFALTGHVAGHSSARQTNRHEVYGPGDGSNRGCVYLTTRDCVYLSKFHVSKVSVHGQTAFAHIRCTGMTECKVALDLTVRESSRGHTVRAEEARAHVRGHHKSAHHKSAKKGHHKSGSKGRHTSTGHKHKGAKTGHKKGNHHGHSGGSSHGSGHGKKPPIIVRTVQVGTVTVTLFGGHHGVYQVKLNGQGRTLLSQFGKLHVRFTARTAARETRGHIYSRVLKFH